MATVHVEVTQSCIDRGERRGATTCPVALAFREAGVTDAIVGAVWLSLPNRPVDEVYDLPDNVRYWIYEYDEHGHGVPFSFDMEIPNHDASADAEMTNDDSA